MFFLKAVFLVLCLALSSGPSFACGFGQVTSPFLGLRYCICEMGVMLAQSPWVAEEIQEGKAACVKGVEKEGSCPWSSGALLSGQPGKCYPLAVSASLQPWASSPSTGHTSSVNWKPFG